MEINPKDLGFTGDETTERHSNDEQSDRSNQDPVSSRPSSSDLSNVLDAPSGSTYHFTKWKRLRKHYSDQYLEIFNSVHNHDVLTDDPHDLLDTQFGAVVWTSDEKKRFFAAVAKFGRHDLPQISRAVATKSSIEVMAYLDAVHTAHIDRQFFMANTKNVSITDIPAAIEIGAACESALQKAADALNAYQEQFDIAAGQNEQGTSWLIDRNVAAQLDVENSNTEVDLGSSLKKGDDTETAEQQVTEQDQMNSRQLFKFSTMLDLSERFFMNRPPNSACPHWKSIVEFGQKPAITEDTANMMFNLVVDRLRQILTTSMHVANARLSSMQKTGYNPSQKLAKSDVDTALDILGMPCDAWEFWTGLARRNEYHIVTGSHNKGESRLKPITYDDVEAALIPRRGRGRRRSMSIGSEASLTESDLSRYQTSSPNSDGANHDDETENTTGSDSESGFAQDEAKLELKNGSQSDSFISSDSEVVDEPDRDYVVGREERRVLLEDALEQYAETADQAAQGKEEKRLWQILGKRPSVDTKEGDEKDIGPRPKMLRKTQEELRGWSCTYMAEWERFGHLEPREVRVTDQLEDQAKDELSAGTESG